MKLLWLGFKVKIPSIKAMKWAVEEGKNFQLSKTALLNRADVILGGVDLSIVSI